MPWKVKVILGFLFLIMVLFFIGTTIIFPNMKTIKGDKAKELFGLSVQTSIDDKKTNDFFDKRKEEIDEQYNILEEYGW